MILPVRGATASRYKFCHHHVEYTPHWFLKESNYVNFMMRAEMAESFLPFTQQTKKDRTTLYFIMKALLQITNTRFHNLFILKVL